MRREFACAHCEKRFVSNRPGPRYCSYDCYVASQGPSGAGRYTSEQVAAHAQRFRENQRRKK